ncbi:MAG: UDP-N-acetylmuramate dehydrogenase [Desulfobacteraceae bacterium]
MELHSNYPLNQLNTFQINAKAKRYVRFDRLDEIVSFLASENLSKRSYLILGGGSNLLFVGDLDDTVLHPFLKGIDIIDRDNDRIYVRVMAGEVWDDWVAFAVARGWGGIENLSLIPGSVGASAIQNIGAYGIEVKSVIDRVETLSLPDGNAVSFDAKSCGFGYRDSRFKSRWPGRHLITAIIFRLQLKPHFELGYTGVGEAVAKIGPPNLANVRQAVIDLRRKKIPDPVDLGNAGSFFKNPIVSAGTLKALLKKYPHLPHFPQNGNRFKLAAGWLIDQCGWKGKSLGDAAVHHQHALVLVNRGNATGREILQLSNKIVQSVSARFGIALEREVRVVGG